ncbi:uncharacterized protein V1518DRAFT_423909 [Limtongia smithiae]|uniref:uncharacterized protein n=1 Tax=Limtongia smithiae TaxID=1125753 RepID=UPI0034CEA1FC
MPLAYDESHPPRRPWAAWPATAARAIARILDLADVDNDDDDTFSLTASSRGANSNSTARYPPWCMSFFVFSFFQAVFATIPLGVVAYFLYLTNRRGADAAPDEYSTTAYLLLISVSAITNFVILASSVTILLLFRNKGGGGTGSSRVRIRSQDMAPATDGDTYGDLAYTYDETDTRESTTFDITNITHVWSIAFVLSQLAMPLLWSAVFVYIMHKSGGISTSCAIPDAGAICGGAYKDTCAAYERACQLVNLIVVSCALDASLWIAGTVSLFISSAITYRRGMFSGLSGVVHALTPSLFMRQSLARQPLIDHGMEHYPLQRLDSTGDDADMLSYTHRHHRADASRETRTYPPTAAREFI